MLSHFNVFGSVPELLYEAIPVKMNILFPIENMKVSTCASELILCKCLL